jgi:hypothetical protein
VQYCKNYKTLIASQNSHFCKIAKVVAHSAKKQKIQKCLSQSLYSKIWPLECMYMLKCHNITVHKVVINYLEKYSKFMQEC